MQIWGGISKMIKFSARTFSLIVSFLWSGYIHGLPEGTVGVVGEGSFEITGNEMVITAPDGSVFEHLGFDVAADETVRFVQPSTDSRVLNRILSENAALINGTVEANGRLYFAAPNGLIFGSGAIIQAAQLHAIAGGLSNDDFIQGIERYSHLSGEVDNQGSISANDVVLGGRSVTNSGTITTTEGTTVLAAGGSMEVFATDSILGVEISQSSTLPDVSVGDLAGQAVLQSGILEASRALLSGNRIEQSGTVTAQEVSFSRFSELSGSEGKVVAEKVILEGAYGGDPENIPEGLSPTWATQSQGVKPTVQLDSAKNEISSLQSSLTFEQLKVRSAVAMDATTAEELNPLLSPQVQHLDLRVAENDLTMGVTFSPVFSSERSTLLLAADKKIIDHENSLNAGYTQLLLYGSNLPAWAFPDEILGQQDWLSLGATTLELDDLSVGLDAATLLILSAENPGFLNFQQELGIEEIPDEQVVVVQEQEEEPFELPEIDGLPIPGAPPVDENQEMNNDQELIGDDPVLDFVEESFAPPVTFSENQLELALENGLLEGYSYYLLSVSSTELLQGFLAEGGGASSLYGGSYALAGPSGTGETASSSEDSSGDSDSGGEENSDSESGSGSGGDGSAVSGVKAVVAPPALPFSPISRPVLSAEAGAILDAALSPRIEGSLQPYIGR